MFEIASPAVYKPYYEQIDWRNRDVKQSSLTLGALWALELLTLYGDAGANERCESCNKGGDLLACSFCNVVYLTTTHPRAWARMAQIRGRGMRASQNQNAAG